MSPLQPLTKVPDNMAEENGAKGINGEDSIDIRNTVGSIAKEVTLSSMGLWPEKKGADSSPSNEHVLNVAFFSFIGFALVEIVAAIIAKSQSMLADSEAMIVDAMTYLFNLAAERLKNRPFTEQELQLPALVRDYHRKKLRLYLELIPPLISVITLLVLTFYVTRDAMDTLMAPETEDTISNEEEPSVKLMLVFSALNLALDIVNVTFFSKLKGGLGFSSLKSGGNKGSEEQIMDTAEKSSGEKSRLLLNESGEFRAYSSVSRKSQTQTFKDDTGGNLLPLSVGMESGSDVDWDIEKSGTGDEEEEESTKGNLNMCSAFTHVCADTMRSIAVVVAAMIAALVEGVTPTSADAIAAVVVSLIIVVSLGPLIQGLFDTWKEIRTLRAPK